MPILISIFTVFLFPGADAPTDSLYSIIEHSISQSPNAKGKPVRSLPDRRKGRLRTIDPFHHEELLENLSENNPEACEEALTEWQRYAEHPVNLNTATVEDLQKLGILDPWQIKALMHYRDSYGRIVRLEELLENVEGFDTRTLEALEPFVCMDNADSPDLPSAKQIVRLGKHRLTARYGRLLKASKGFAENKYAGSPNSAYLRYTFNFKERILLGLAARQDAGEAFSKQGFDFYSGHLTLKSFGPIKNLTIGNYKADFGYGLNIHSPNGFFGGTQAGLLAGGGQGFRPYASGAEYGFLQGAAVQLKLPHAWQTSLFYSFDRHDANLQTDSLTQSNDFWNCLRSFPETGYHRTPTEIKGKDAVNLQIFGIAVEKDLTHARIGFLTSGYLLGGIYTPEHRTNNKGDLHSQLRPARSANFSVYYQYLSRHFHLYGEAAVSHSAQAAVLQGIQYKPTETLAVDLRYTWQGAEYHAAYASIGNRRPSSPASPGTEKHLFSWQGKALLPADLRLEFSGSESIERKNAGIPVHSETFTGILHYEARRFSAYLRFRLDRTKNRNGSSLRFNAAYQSNGFFGESRLELRDFSKGILLLQDAGYSALRGGFRIRLRVALFHTESYDSRIYAYEHDLLYSASAPALYGKGMRFFILLNKSFGRFTAEFKYSHTLMDGVQSIGSGDNRIKGFLKPEIKVQVHLKL